MAECSVCGKPAASQITITENSQRRQLMLCDEHYMGFMARNQRRLSPLESLFHGGLFDSLFDDMWPKMESGRGSRSRIGRSPGHYVPVAAGCVRRMPL
jgi:ATP-dependent Clp protease ATP-binding subunit ClpC